MAEPRDIVRRCIEELVAKRDADPGVFLTEDYEHHSPDPSLPPGIEGFRRFHDGLHQAFPDLRIEILELVAEGDVVAARTRWTATHRGNFMGMAPHGKALDVELFEFFYLRDGKVCRHRAKVDTAAIARQLAS